MNYSHILQCDESHNQCRGKKKKQVTEFHCRLPATTRHPDDFLVTSSDYQEPHTQYDSISVRKN